MTEWFQIRHNYSIFNIDVSGIYIIEGKELRTMTTTIKFKVNTKSSPLMVRKGPGMDYEIVDKLQKGSTHNAIGTSGDWYKLGDNRWCYKNYCKVINTTTNNKDKDSNTSKRSSTSKETLKNSKGISDKIKSIVNAKNESLNSVLDSSMRLIGLPHQMIAATDKRISTTSNIGRVFAETFMMDAPLIYLKPGTSNFLPGLSKKQQESLVGAVLNYVTSDGDTDSTKKSFAQALSNLKGDELRYFEFKQDFAKYISRVNMLNRIGAVFLGIHEYKVPWVTKGNVTFGTYDWRYYNASNIFNTTEQNMKTGESDSTLNVLGGFISNAMKVVSDAMSNDDRYIQFYVDANASFSESISNGTTSSIITQFTEQLEGLGKELSFVSGVSGLDINGIADAGLSATDQAISSIVSGDGAISTFLRKLTGTTSQILTGSNFVAPDVWSDNEYSKSYSFTISLATPYGNPVSWYLNMWVPMSFVLGMVLPSQTSANTYTAPPLIQAFSPGWFAADLGMVDSVSIEKAPSGDSWSSNGLPNEIKISISIKDLYSSLALPDNYSIKDFYTNTGLINFLLVNCGVDITKASVSNTVNLMLTLFANNIEGFLEDGVYSKWYDVKEHLNKLFNLYQ